MMIESLTQAVAALKQTLSGPNVVVVERKMSEMNQLWTRLEEDKDKREKGDCLVIQYISAYCVVKTVICSAATCSLVFIAVYIIQSNIV